MTTRMQSGAAFAGPLGEIETLSGQDAPEALTTAAEGVATARELIRGFGRAAKGAKAGILSAEAGDDVLGQAGARLESMLAGRPKSEQDGSGQDAILSRIEARLQDGDLAAALAEAESLPDAGQAGMGDWLARLKARVAAEEAAEAYIAAIQESKS